MKQSHSIKLSPRQELLRMQRRIFLQNERIINESASIAEKGFRDYEYNYYKRLKKFERVSTVEELEEELLKAQIVYVGDYHTNKQSQRAFLRILKLLQKRKCPFVIALELLHLNQQKKLDAYLNHQMTEWELIQKIQLKKRWYLDLWPNFSSLFHFAKQHKVTVKCIEAAAEGSSLYKRDEAMAEQIVKLSQQYPKHKIMVLVGDLHIAKEHLPACVENQLELKRLFVYQNSAPIYWKLAEAKREEKTEIVKVDKESFCLMNTPPILWQQSYLNWLENEGEEIDFADAQIQVHDLVKRLAKFLSIKLSSQLENLEVYSCGDLSFLERLQKEKDVSVKEFRQIKQQILSSQSYTIPRKHVIYLGSMSLNHAAEEASHYLKFLCAGEEFPRDAADAFYVNILHEALGFFGSKIINHQRKCMHDNDFKKLLSYLSNLGTALNKQSQFEMECSRLVLRHLQLEKREQCVADHLSFRNSKMFFALTHALGYRLGDKLYYAMMQGKISKKQIKDLFEEPFIYPGQAAQVYLWLIKKCEEVKIPKRM